MCVDVFPAYMSLCHAHAWFPLRPGKGVRFPTGATGNCEPPCECWEWNPGLLNHQVISPAPLSAGFWNCGSLKILLLFCSRYLNLFTYLLYSLPIAHFVLYICLKRRSCFIFIFSDSHIFYEYEIFCVFLIGKQIVLKEYWNSVLGMRWLSD